MDIHAKTSRPFRVGFMLIDGFSLMTYASAVEPLRAANVLAGREIYDVRQVPVLSAQASSSSKATISADAQIGEQVDFDLVVIVAGDEAFEFAQEGAFHWLRNLARRGVALGGVSGGAVVLARAGLLKGRSVAVHWEYSQALAEILPDLQQERILYVMEDDRMTCAGGVAPMDMMHALIEKQHGAQFARSVSDWFLHTQVRASEGPQRAGLAERYGTKNSTIVSAIALMEDNLAEPVSLQVLAKSAGVGVRQLNRLFSTHLGSTTMELYRRLRLIRLKFCWNRPRCPSQRLDWRRVSPGLHIFREVIAIVMAAHHRRIAIDSVLGQLTN